MKKLLRLLFVTMVAAGVSNSVQAQRGAIRSDRGRSNMNTNVMQPRAERSYRNIDSRYENVRINSSGNYNRIINNTQQRNDVALREINRRDNYSVTQQRDYRGNSDISRVRYPSQNIPQRNVVQRNYNTYNNYGRNYSRGGYYPRYAFMGGPRYTVLPRSSISIYFGGYPYYYNSGFFYGRFGGYYEPLFPPIGIHIGVLPFGYSRIFIGADLFYYFNGIYYRHNHEKKDYEVIDAPMGATVSSLPKGAKSVVLNGEKLYELNGTYYKEDRNFKGETVYTVVGKNGEVNNSNDVNADAVSPPASLTPGDVIDQLPDGSKAVTINGEKLYVTPDDVYVKEENDGDVVKYKVVGK